METILSPRGDSKQLDGLDGSVVQTEPSNLLIVRHFPQFVIDRFRQAVLYQVALAQADGEGTMASPGLLPAQLRQAPVLEGQLRPGPLNGLKIFRVPGHQRKA